jgi:pimeloyl-ACP methyl ester carboxylesterase
MPRSSSLARLQQLLAAGIAIAALVWFMAWWPARPVLAMAGALLIVFAHAVVLAIEFVLLRATSAKDPAPKPSARQLFIAWCRETCYATVVFGWRQPFAWRELPDNLEGTAGRTGLVFIHGFVCNRGFWTPWMRQARAAGHPFIGVNLEPVFCDIDDYAATIEEAVARMTAASGRKPILVCHSMGGLAARAWLRKYDGAARIAHVVTIGSPHRGTWLARFSRLPNGRQMRIGCDWMSALPAEAPPSLFTCWYSNCDNIVFPPSTATMPGADNRHLPGAAHVDLAFRAEVLQHTLAQAAAL